MNEVSRVAGQQPLTEGTKVEESARGLADSYLRRRNQRIERYIRRSLLWAILRWTLGIILPLLGGFIFARSVSAFDSAALNVAFFALLFFAVYAAPLLAWRQKAFFDVVEAQEENLLWLQQRLSTLLSQKRTEHLKSLAVNRVYSEEQVRALRTHYDIAQNRLFRAALYTVPFIALVVVGLFIMKSTRADDQGYALTITGIFYGVLGAGYAALRLWKRAGIVKSMRDVEREFRKWIRSFGSEVAQAESESFHQSQVDEIVETIVRDHRLRLPLAFTFAATGVIMLFAMLIWVNSPTVAPESVAVAIIGFATSLLQIVIAGFFYKLHETATKEAEAIRRDFASGQARADEKP